MADKDKAAETAKPPLAPATQKVVVEGEPLSAPGAGDAVPLEKQGLNPSKLAQAQGAAAATAGEDNPSPDVGETVKAAEQFVADLGEANDMSASGAKSMLAAADAETLWVPDSEKLSVYASPIGKTTYQDHGDSDAAGTSANAPDSPDKRALAGSKK